MPISFAKSAELPNVRLIPFSEEIMDWNIHMLKQKNGMLSPKAKSLERQFLEHSKNLNNADDKEKQDVE